MQPRSRRTTSEMFSNVMLLSRARPSAIPSATMLVPICRLGKGRRPNHFRRHRGRRGSLCWISSRRMPSLETLPMLRVCGLDFQVGHVCVGSYIWSAWLRAIHGATAPRDSSGYCPGGSTILQKSSKAARPGRQDAVLEAGARYTSKIRSQVHQESFENPIM